MILTFDDPNHTMWTSYVGATYQVARKSLKEYSFCVSFLVDGKVSAPPFWERGPEGEGQKSARRATVVDKPCKDDLSGRPLARKLVSGPGRRVEPLHVS